MKLSDAQHCSLIESTFFESINEEGEAPRWKFRYDNFKVDPTPDILLLGQWRHPNTGNDLVGGINTNYLSKKQVVELAKALPKIMQASNLYQRYWVGRRLLPDIFNNFYRTYNSSYIRGVQQDTMQPKHNFRKAAADWIKKKLGDIFKSKKQRKLDAKPKYPQDLDDMQDTLNQTMADLHKQVPDRPSDEPEDSPEMRRARAAFQQFQRDQALQDLAAQQPDDDIMGQIEQNAIPSGYEEEPGKDPNEIDADNVRDQFEKERDENLEDNEELDESIVYYDSAKGRFVQEAT